MAGEFTALRAKLGRISDALGPAGMRAALTDVGVQAKKDLAIEGAVAVGADLRYSGWKRLGAVKSGFDIDGTTVIVKPRPFGGWIVAEKGRKHTTAPKRRKTVVLATPWGPRTYTREHPLAIGATRGKGALTKATERIQRSSPQRYDEALQRQLRELFGG